MHRTTIATPMAATKCHIGHTNNNYKKHTMKKAYAILLYSLNYLAVNNPWRTGSSRLACFVDGQYMKYWKRGESKLLDSFMYWEAEPLTEAEVRFLNAYNNQ